VLYRVMNRIIAIILLLTCFSFLKRAFYLVQFQADIDTDTEDEIASVWIHSWYWCLHTCSTVHVLVCRASPSISAVNANFLSQYCLAILFCGLLLLSAYLEMIPNNLFTLHCNKTVITHYLLKGNEWHCHCSYYQ
jgi:hypothetical protein